MFLKIKISQILNIMCNIGSESNINLIIVLKYKEKEKEYKYNKFNFINILFYTYFSI